MAGTTTIAGFASNVTSSISLMKDFGLFTAFGVLVALLISLTLIPSILVLRAESKRKFLQPAKNKTEKRKKTDSRLDQVLRKLSQLVTERSTAVILVILILAALALGGLHRLETDSNFLTFSMTVRNRKLPMNW